MGRVHAVQSLGAILPIAVALAVSSVPIMTTIVILLSAHRSRSALPFMIGWAAGIVLVVCLCALLAQAVPASRPAREPDTAVGIIEIVVGVTLVFIAVIRWRHPRVRTATASPKWLSTAGALGPWSASGLGLILNLRPKSILLAIAAGLTLRADVHSLPSAVVIIAIYTAIAASTVAVPIIATSVWPARMQPRLVAANDWLARNGGLVGIVILVVIGVVIVGVGITRL